MSEPQTIDITSPIQGACSLSDLTGAEVLAMRHRSNPYGSWKRIASTAERPGINYHVVALLADGSWTRVLYHEASGRTAGIEETTPRKKKGSKKD